MNDKILTINCYYCNKILQSFDKNSGFEIPSNLQDFFCNSTCEYNSKQQECIERINKKQEKEEEEEPPLSYMMTFTSGRFEENYWY